MKKSLFLTVFLLIFANVAYGKLIATKFPGTVDDLSFSAKESMEQISYKPFLDKKAYQELNIVPGEEEYIDHTLAVLEAEAQQQTADANTMSFEEYCAKYYDIDSRCPQHEEQTYGPIGPFTGTTIGGDSVVLNNSVIGGSCYPADHDSRYANKVFTTGRFEKISPAFEKALITIFRKEGTTCGTIPNDKGGFSCYGIASNAQKISPAVLAKYTIADAENLYYERFWKRYKLYELPDVISTDVFLAGMASGMGTAFGQFREFLGLKGTSTVIDDEMINAIKNYQGDIHNDWLDLREKFLMRVAAKYYPKQPNVKTAYKHSIIIKRKNGCHTQPVKPLYRNN